VFTDCTKSVREMDANWKLTTLTNLQIKFPVIGLKIPVPRNNFPVNLNRELLDKWLQHSGFLLQIHLRMPQNRKIPC
jgi:hypothetical protein